MESPVKKIRHTQSINSIEFNPIITCHKNEKMLCENFKLDLTNFIFGNENVFDHTYILSQPHKSCIRIIYNKTLPIRVDTLCTKNALTGCQTRKSNCDSSRFKIILLTSCDTGSLNRDVIKLIESLAIDEKVGVVYHSINNNSSHAKNLFLDSLKITSLCKRKKLIDIPLSTIENSCEQKKTRIFLRSSRRKKNNENDINEISNSFNNLKLNPNEYDKKNKKKNNSCKLNELTKKLNNLDFSSSEDHDVPENQTKKHKKNPKKEI